MSGAVAGAVIGAVSGDGLAGPLREGRLGDFQARSSFAACLMPLLQALGWRQEPRNVAEALPHFADSLGLADLRNVLARLGYGSERFEGDAPSLDKRLLPCLLVRANGEAAVLLEKLDGGRFRCFDGTRKSEDVVDARLLRGSFYRITPRTEDRVAKRFEKDNWLAELTVRFRGLLVLLAGMTLFLNSLALLVPLYVMTIYDQVIPTRSSGVLLYLGSGIAIALLVEGLARILRARIIAFLGGRIDYLVATSALDHVLSLPLTMTENVSVGKQIARLREFDVLRELFTGPFVSVVLELPFILVFLAVIAVIAGPLVYVPLVMMGLFLLITLALAPKLRRAVAEAGAARSERHSHLVETVTHIHTIHEANAGAAWHERFRERSAEACYSHYKASRVSFLFQTLSQTIMMIAGLATIAFGVDRVLAAELTVGGLIATMALTWRVLAPMQNLFLTLARFEQIRSSLSQINRLMRLPTEKTEVATSETRREFLGGVEFSRVSFRYNAESEPALLGVSFRVEPGEMLAVTGPSGSGKSTLLRLALGLHAPQAGKIAVGGLDIRQIEPAELRRSIAYVPQTTNLFHGSIAQNLRLVNPAATDEELLEACRKAGLESELAALKQGLDTRLGDNNTAHFNTGFRQRLSLARAHVRRAPVVLLDEAANRLDESGDASFIESLKQLKGAATVLLVTHRPSHMRLADKLLVLRDGRIVAAGRPEELLKAQLEAS